MRAQCVAMCLLFLCGCETLLATTSYYALPKPHRLTKHLQNIKKDFGSQPKHFAFLIGANTEVRHRNNLSLAYQVLIEQGYDRQHIFILDSEGGTPAIYPISDTLTQESMGMMFNWLSKNLSQIDTILVYVTGHGNQKSLLLNRAEEMSKQNFLFYLSSIKIRTGIVIFDQCYWGAPKIKSPFIFISATSDLRTSHGVSFPRMFWRAFRRLEDPVISISQAFDFARAHDRGRLFGHQQPEIFFSTIHPARIDLLGNPILNPRTGIGETLMPGQ